MRAEKVFNLVKCPNSRPWVQPMAIIVMPIQGILEVSEHFNFGGMLIYKMGNNLTI